MLTKLVADLESADSGVYSRAVQELVELGPAAVPALIAGLQKGRDDRRLACRYADVLGRMGPDARPALPLLVSLINPGGGFRWNGDDQFPTAVLSLGGEPAQEDRRHLERPRCVLPLALPAETDAGVRRPNHPAPG
jgi:hypothetical protein